MSHHHPIDNDIRNTQGSFDEEDIFQHEIKSSDDNFESLRDGELGAMAYSLHPTILKRRISSQQRTRASRERKKKLRMSSNCAERLQAQREPNDEDTKTDCSNLEGNAYELVQIMFEDC
jgi:hypothetical protein